MHPHQLLHMSVRTKKPLGQQIKILEKQKHQLLVTTVIQWLLNLSDYNSVPHTQALWSPPGRLQGVGSTLNLTQRQQFFKGHSLWLSWSVSAPETKLMKDPRSLLPWQLYLEPRYAHLVQARNPSKDKSASQVLLSSSASSLRSHAETPELAGIKHPHSSEALLRFCAGSQSRASSPCCPTCMVLCV